MRRLLEATGATNIVCLVDVPPIQLDLTKLTTLSLLVVEVVTKALKHAFTPDARGTITIRLEHLDAQRLGLTIADDGRGMPAGFKPESSRSLGFRISQGLASQLGGVLTYQDGRVPSYGSSSRTRWRPWRDLQFGSYSAGRKLHHEEPLDQRVHRLMLRTTVVTFKELEHTSLGDIATRSRVTDVLHDRSPFGPRRRNQRSPFSLPCSRYGSTGLLNASTGY